MISQASHTSLFTLQMVAYTRTITHVHYNKYFHASSILRYRYWRYSGSFLRPSGNGAARPPRAAFACFHCRCGNWFSLQFLMYPWKPKYVLRTIKINRLLNCTLLSVLYTKIKVKFSTMSAVAVAWARVYSTTFASCNLPTTYVSTSIHHHNHV